MKIRVALLGLLLVTLLPACRRGMDQPAMVPTAAERQFPLTGVIVTVDAAHKTLLVSHDAVDGFMPAMTMEFRVSSADVAAAKEGEHIRAQLFPDDPKGARLEKIWPVDPVAESIVAAAQNALRQDTSARANHAYREIGESLPDFGLYNQDGQVVTAARFHGKQVMLNFIYTRCPIATMCPASTARMVEAQQLARANGVTSLELVSISLDPEYDTPAVLKEYARTHGINPVNFSLLTGPEKAIKDLLTQFGIIANFDGGILKHTLATLLIDTDGKIIWREDGSQWTPEEFVRKMRRDGPAPAGGPAPKPPSG
jgi:protein SCO1/2